MVHRDESRSQRPGRAVLAALARSLPAAVAAVCLAVLTFAGHDLAIWLVARFVSYAASLDGVRQLAVAAPGDDMYARLVLSMLGNMQVKGLVHAGWLAVMFSAGSSAVGVHAVQLLVNLGIVLAGSAVITIVRPWRANSGLRWLASLAVVLCVAYAAGTEMRLSWSSGSGGEMALSMVATKVLGIDSRLYDSLLRHGQLLSLAINLVTLLAAAAAGLLCALPIRRAVRPARQPKGSRERLGISSAAIAVALLCACVRPAVAFEPSHASALPAPKPGARLASIVSMWPSVVTVTRQPGGNGWDYVVNGRKEIIRGIGYNAVTTGDTPPERAARYDRDFTAIAATGANTIVGWSEQEFDDVLMQKAAEHGLGVLLPFQLGPSYVLAGPDYAYEDPQVQQQLMDAVVKRVEHYRNSPALRMWGLGNEVLHSIAWAHGSSARSQAFAEFLIRAADRVHELDPNHPVVYRDAEDWYAKFIIRALADNPKPRPWFIYSMNFFTPRMDEALASGPAATMGQPLLISEFGPVGLRPEDRPNGYRQLWEIIRAHGDKVLGGSAYVWTTAGPEPLDRNFGLTDANGQPVDGALAELSALFSVP